MSSIPTFACHIEPARQGVSCLSCRNSRRTLTDYQQGEEPAAITTFHKALQKIILGLITLSVDDDRGLSPTQTKDLLKLVLFCIRQTRKTTEPLTIQVWDPAAWKTLHGQLSSSNRFKSSSSVLNMCRQVESTAAQCKQAVGGKRKAESDEATETDPSKKSNRKKQKKSKS